MKRLQYLDFAKGLCILLIAFGHFIPNENILLNKWAYSFHVPIFFIISGILMEYTKEYERPFFKIILKNILQLGIPYIFFETLANLVLCIPTGLNTIVWREWQTIILYGTGFATWFLPVLLFCKITLICLNKLFKHRIIIGGLCLSCLMFGVCCGLDYHALPWFYLPAFRSLIAIGFLWFGTILINAVPKIMENNLCLILCGIISVISAILNDKVSLFMLHYGNPLLFILAAVSSSVLIMGIGNKFQNEKYISYFGENSLIILGTHQIFLTLFQYATSESFVDSYWFLFFITTIIIEVPVIYVINRFFPFIIGKKI